MIKGGGIIWVTACIGRNFMKRKCRNVLILVTILLMMSACGSKATNSVNVTTNSTTGSAGNMVTEVQKENPVGEKDEIELIYEQFLDNKITAYSMLQNDTANRECYISGLCSGFGLDTTKIESAYIYPGKNKLPILLVKTSHLYAADVTEPYEINCYVISYNDGKLYATDMFDILTSHSMAEINEYGVVKCYQGMSKKGITHGTYYIDENGMLQKINSYISVGPYDGLYGSESFNCEQNISVFNEVEKEVYEQYGDMVWSCSMTIDEYYFDEAYYLYTIYNNSEVAEKYIELCKVKGLRFVSENEVSALFGEKTKSFDSAMFTEKDVQWSKVEYAVDITSEPVYGFVSWEDSGKTDHVMVWMEEEIEEYMRLVTGIYDRDLMLSDVWEVTTVSLYGDGLNNIDALGELTNITKLILTSNNIEDISALGNLVNLNELYLELNDITDISPLENLVNLKILDLSANEIVDISVLKELHNLEDLDLFGNPIDDFSALASLKKMKKLALQATGISNIEPLSELMSLEVLVLWDNNVSDLGPLGNLYNLEWLYLGGNEITDVSALAGLTNLVYLDLDNNNIKDVSPLAGLKNLSTLHLYMNPITDYSPVEFANPYY